MNLDQSLEVLKAQRDKAQAAADALSKAVEAATAAQDAEASSKKAVRERAKLETDLEKFRKDTRAEIGALTAELETAQNELAATRAQAKAIQDKQREDYAKAELEHKIRMAAMEKQRAEALAARVQLQNEIDALEGKKKQMEAVARAMLPA